MHYNSRPGQGSIVAISVTILLGLVISGFSLSLMSMNNARHSIVTRQNLQTYYTAKAGIMEAVATRMLPRSNYQNFNPIHRDSLGLDPFFPNSGFIFRDPSDTLTTPGAELMGIYRYIVVGGDQARKNNGDYYDENDLAPDGTPWLLTIGNMPDDSPFYVVSHGITCQRDNGEIGINQFTGSFVLNNPDYMIPEIFPVPGDPGYDAFFCNNGWEVDELWMVAKVEMEMANLPSDQITSIQVFKDPSDIRLDRGAFVPGWPANDGWMDAGSNFQDDTFNKAWAYKSSDPGNPAVPRLAVFYNLQTNEVYNTLEINDTTESLPNNPANRVPQDAAIRVYFEGPVDFRSISTNPEDCATSPATCEVTMEVIDPPNPPTFYPDVEVFPGLPGSTYLLLLPPFKGNTSGTGTEHRITIDMMDTPADPEDRRGVTGFSGADAIEDDYTISFHVE